MRPSSRLFLDPVDVSKNKRAVQRASELVKRLSSDADYSPELLPPGPPAEGSATPSPNKTGKPESRKISPWELVAGVAERHPRLLVWLAEGRVTWYWNLYGTMIAALRLIPGVGRLMWRILFEPVEDNAPWRPELYETILQKKRYDLNMRLRQGPDPGSLTLKDTPGLSALTDVTMFTPPAGYADLEDKIMRMSSGCIGISGLPGSGKSAVIRYFCSKRYGTPEWEEDPGASDAREKGVEVKLPGLRLMVEAPLLYDAREFLVHMYTCLCRAVLTQAELNATPLRRAMFIALLGRRSVRPAALLRTLGGICLLIAAAGLVYRAVTGGWPLSLGSPQIWEVAGACVAAVAALAIFSWRTREGLLEIHQIRALATDAEERLERLHFQRTDTRGYGSTLGGPNGTGLNVTSTHALTEQLMTLPELVNDYRDFAERVVAALRSSRLDALRQARTSQGSAVQHDARQDAGDIRLVIGIDQVDRIEDTQAARVFLNELSSVFGTPHCVYLIAVSPSTSATIDRRTVPLKTASGGIFDDMVWVEPLDFHGVLELLDYRVVGLPASFVALCYVLSGGLPRDLFRVARSIFAARDLQARQEDPRAGQPIDLAKAARHVIADEIRSLKRRTLAHAAAQDATVSPDLLMKLTDRDWPITCLDKSASSSASAHAGKEVLADISGLWAEAVRDQRKRKDRRSAAIGDNFLSGLYFLLVIRELFTARKDLLTKLGVCRSDGTCDISEHKMLSGLARARLALSQDPYLARAVLRSAIEGPAPLAGADVEFLRSAAESAASGQEAEGSTLATLDGT